MSFGYSNKVGKIGEALVTYLMKEMYKATKVSNVPHTRGRADKLVTLEDGSTFLVEVKTEQEKICKYGNIAVELYSTHYKYQSACELDTVSGPMTEHLISSTLKASKQTTLIIHIDLPVYASKLLDGELPSPVLAYIFDYQKYREYCRSQNLKKGSLSKQWTHTDCLAHGLLIPTGDKQMMKQLGLLTTRDITPFLDKPSVKKAITQCKEFSPSVAKQKVNQQNLKAWR